MSPEGRKVTVEFSEHDALKLITLIRQELYRTDKSWRPYWLRVARDIEQGIEHASLRAFHQQSNCFRDLSSEP
jgi:hypothetical protein